MKDLNALNETLFETLDKVVNKQMDVKQAAAIVNVSNAIISSGKLQLQAYKMANANTTPTMMGIEQTSNGKVKKPLLISEIQAIKEKPQDHSMEAFVKRLGYDSVAEASADMGSDTLDKKYGSWKANQ